MPSPADESRKGPPPASSAVEMDEAAGKSNKSTRARANRDRTKLRPILTPIPSDNASGSPSDELGFGNFVTDVEPCPDAATNNPTTHSTAAAIETANAPPPHRAMIKPRPAAKLRPRSSPFSPDESADGADDPFAAFGFGTVRTNLWKTDDAKESSSVARAVERDEGASSPPTPRRCQSPESYISDDSSTAGYGPRHLYPHRQMKGGASEEDALEVGTAATTATHSRGQSEIDDMHMFDSYYYPVGFAENPQSALPFLSQQFVPKLHIRSNSAPHVPSSLELKLSLSEESNGTPTRSDDAATSSQSVSSGDDVVSNELSSYYPISEVWKRGPSSGAWSDFPSGRCTTPVDDRHAASVVARSSNEDDTPTPVLAFRATPQSAILAAAASTRRSAARPLAHHQDPSFLTNNQRGGWGAGGTVVIGSPRGAFDEPAEREGRSPPSRGGGDPFVKSRGGALPSLAYSDDEDYNNNPRPWNGNERGDADEEATAKDRKLPDEGTRISVYPSRWIMLMFVSVLNLLGGWTCYIVSPISELSTTTLDVDSDGLVAIYFAAAAIAGVAEPVILRRLGLRRTVLLGALLLMTGNMVKCGGCASDVNSTNRWHLYFGTILAGSSGPLYQSTPFLLITSWFPQRERTVAAGVAMYSNHFGIGCSFVFGTRFVRTGGDLFPYFHFLSVVSTIAFVAVAMQFSDCPPTPPSGTARVIRGTVERPIFVANPHNGMLHCEPSGNDRKVTHLLPSAGSFESIGKTLGSSVSDYSTIAMLPPSAPGGSAGHAVTDEATSEYAPLARGTVNNKASTRQSYGSAGSRLTKSERNDDVSALSSPFPNLKSFDEASRGAMPFQPWLEFYSYNYDSKTFQPKDHLPPTSDDGAEPIMTQTPRHLDIDICDDQIWRSIRACFGRRGFAHCLAVYAMSAIVINTIAAFIYHLVTLKGAGTDYVGIVGGAFQLMVVISSVMCRRLAGGSQRFYMNIATLLLSLSALTLALCGANLGSGVRLWLNLLLVAVFISPLQPLTTQLGAEFVFPLSESTVVVIQQLFSNLMSACTIPVFKALRHALVTAPDFTFSFCLFVLMLASSTIYFASFYAEYSHREEEKKREFTRIRLEQSQPPNHEYGISSYPLPRPPVRRDWKKHYPFLIPRRAV
ncbi:hypothetical protein ACHAW5_002688 [Stephanodiscus triporus]|uniref:Major facilitator superfamily (MFS) profile domain-containing protein n=1 Tax=Stephanodiscus triporus TaxID=2934178 RepID=A0ABD3N3L4_9STRA